MGIEYHLKELEIALNADDPRRVMPTLLDTDEVLLDIGCGIGQSFIALDSTDRTCVGIDNDKESTAYGIKNYGDKIQFIHTDAHQIPIPSKTFDLVFCRVSLPYTNIPKVIKEIKRVLQKDGRVWLTIHTKKIAVGYLTEAIEKPFQIKRLVHVLYILTNGYLLKYFGFLLPFINGKYESWQDASALEKLLKRNGFEVKVQEVGGHTVIEGML